MTNETFLLQNYLQNLGYFNSGPKNVKFSEKKNNM